MSLNLSSEADLAAILGVSVKQTQRLRLKHNWEHVCLGKNTVRYTDHQIAIIIDSRTVRPPTTQEAAPVAGRTARSRARRSA